MEKPEYKKKVLPNNNTNSYFLNILFWVGFYPNGKRRYSIFNQHNKMKELIKKLTEYYDWCIQNMPEEGWDVFCAKYNIHFGICKCANTVFDTYIYDTNFIQDFTNGSNRLCKTPTDANTFKEALESLRTRHKRLLEMADYK